MMKQKVTCGQCGRKLPQTEAILEEGDRWECPTCWSFNEIEELREAAFMAKQDAKEWMTKYSIEKDLAETANAQAVAARMEAADATRDVQRRDEEIRALRNQIEILIRVIGDRL